MTHVSDRYKALLQAAHASPPPCTEDDLFIADDLTRADQERLAAVCDRCPIRALCADYATTARPAAGFWAGRRYPSTKNGTGNA